MTTKTHWLRRWAEHRIPCAPSTLNSVDYRFLVDAGNAPPLGGRSHNPVNLNKPIVAPVVVLLNRCRPSAVAWFVVSSCIRESIKAMCGRWTLSHVGKKSLKAVSPLIAHGNSESTVFVEICSRGVMAPRFNALPNTVFRGRIVGVHRSSVCRNGIPMEAAARLCIHGSQTISQNHQSRSAIAYAIPHRRANRFCAIDNKKPAESPSGYVNEFCHFSESFI